MYLKSTAQAIPSPKGWRAQYQLGDCRSEPSFVCGMQGRPIDYPTAADATIAAQEALLAAMERVDAEHIEPVKREASARPWEVIRSAKSKAGRRAIFQSVFKEREAAE